MSVKGTCTSSWHAANSQSCHDRGCVNVSGSTSLHTCIGLALMQGVWWKFMSMADELPGKPNVEVAP